LSAAGQFVTAYSFTYAVTTPIMATLTAHWSRRRVLLIGLLVFIAGNLMTAMVRGFDSALLSRCVAGLGGAMVTPAAGAAAAALVAAEHRGWAMAVVLAGLSASTALGAPIGTVVGSLGDWKTTMWLVAALGGAASLGVMLTLPGIGASPVLGLRERLAPLRDARVTMTLATTFLAMLGVFLVYTYISAVFDRATGGNGKVLALLLASWGLGATVGILGAGYFSDRFGSRPVINAAIITVALDFGLIPWTSAEFSSAVVALVLWGLCGWGLVLAQQHRLVSIHPSSAPILIALNGAAIYFAVSASGALGALVIQPIGSHNLPLLSSLLILLAFFCAERAYRLIHSRTQGEWVDIAAGRAERRSA
jgi:predicted MFS family arabinose efflux permease